MPPAAGQPATTEPNEYREHPLAPPDTSSPRDTLRSFLALSDELIEAQRAGTESPAKYRAYFNILETLDFSSTPDRDSWVVQTERVLLLKEILDRVAIPPDSEIPGDREVAEDAFTRWTIPDTRITIERVKNGPRAGDFLFSPDTVERLDRYYREAKHLPYKPGAAVGLYESVLRSDRPALAAEAQVRNRLKPVDTSSPRSTLEGFLDSVNRAYALVMEADAALEAEPPTMPKERAREVEITAGNLLHRAVSTLDLSQVPEALREDVGLESALQLKEIFDRTVLPPIDSVPNAQMVAAAREAAARPDSLAAGPLRWRYPNTEIEIVEVTEGERQGQFLFSAGTVSRLSDFYEEVRDLPYRRDILDSIAYQYSSPAKSEGFYEYYASTPGYLIPRANFLGRLVDGLPGPFKTTHHGLTNWQWLGLLLCVLLLALVARVVFRDVGRIRKRLGSPLSDWLRILPPVIVGITVYFLGSFIHEDLNITGTVLGAVTTGGRAVVLVMTAWAAFVLFKAVAETIIASPRIPEQSLDASLLRIGTFILGLIIGGWIVIKGIKGLGADVVPLLAGLGVGGLAVALAAQRTIANFIGCLILFLNKPVRIGDFCRYGDRIGTVEHIGLISTRIRSLERSIVTVPNAEFSEMKLDNFAKRDQMLLRSLISLRYETTPEQLRHVLAKLRELLVAHPKVTPDPARVRFVGFGRTSLDLEVFAYVRTSDWNEFLGIREDLYLRMMDIVAASGTGFAFPSQTLYLTRDRGLDSEKSAAAAAEVQQWRDEHRLPFPEFNLDFKISHRDTLDFPPAGSPEADESRRR